MFDVTSRYVMVIRRLLLFPFPPPTPLPFPHLSFSCLYQLFQTEVHLLCLFIFSENSMWEAHLSHALHCSICLQSYKGIGNTILQEMTLCWGAQNVSSLFGTACILKGFSENSPYVLFILQSKWPAISSGHIVRLISGKRICGRQDGELLEPALTLLHSQRV